MSVDETRRPHPIEGTLYPVTFGRAAMTCLLGLAITLLGAFIVAWRFDLLDFMRNVNRFVTWWGLLIGIFFALGGPFMVGITVFEFMRKRTLILGKDCMQLVDTVRGEARVRWQVTYANIAQCTLTCDRDNNYLKIWLTDFNDVDCFTDVTPFETQAKAADDHYHLGIHDIFGTKIKTIQQDLDDRLDGTITRRKS